MSKYKIDEIINDIALMEFNRIKDDIKSKKTIYLCNKFISFFYSFVAIIIFSVAAFANKNGYFAWAFFLFLVILYIAFCTCILKKENNLLKQEILNYYKK